MHAELEYVSLGCNRTPHAADWSSTGLLAYGASQSVALAEETEVGRGPTRVFTTLHGHNGRVNCVRWIASSPSPCSVPLELLSGGGDGKVILWRGEDGEFSVKQELSSHTSSVTCVTGQHLLPRNTNEGESPPIRTLIASASGDSTLIIWERPSVKGEFVLFQRISFGRGFALGLDFCILSNSEEPMLACGSDDGKVSLFIQNEEKFASALCLSGHSDWVRDVQFVREREGGDLLLASCSQDTSIRLWRISQQQEEEEEEDSKQRPPQEEDDELRLKGNVFTLSCGVSFVVTLESILMGHEDWVYSICWSSTDQSDCREQCIQLLSSSMDKTLILWKPDPASGVWLEEVRVGEVGGNTLGFYGGLISPRGQLILAHDYQGGFHLWGKEERRKKSENEGPLELRKDERSLEVWVSLPTIGGHFAAVQGLAWEPRSGAYLLSVGSDQTTRLHAVWNRNGKEKTPCPKCRVFIHFSTPESWFEIARPQIHGYDMTCVAMTTSLQYTSGADEKVLRVFEAPTNFVANLSKISQKHLQKEKGDVPIGASVPSLGLSNKAVFTCDDVTPEKQVTKNPFADHIPSFKPVDLEEPPVEAHLLQNTLWPETQKLYGHGYEIYCITASPNGRYIATACKATKIEHAVIRVWEVKSWKQLPALPHHTLTITHLTFSHSSRLLLATSRDRTWSLWREVDTGDGVPFQLCASLPKSSRLHSRVIWTASWVHDDSCFATGSRDKKVLLWKQGGCEGGSGDCGGGWSVMTPPLELPHSVTALDFAPSPTPHGKHILAVGLESGQILLQYCSLTPDLKWEVALTLPPRLFFSFCHTATVKQLSWKPQRVDEHQMEHSATLASCSHDNSVKLFKIHFRN